jgi:hypothetical protein
MMDTNPYLLAASMLVAIEFNSIMLECIAWHRLNRNQIGQQGDCDDDVK